MYQSRVEAVRDARAAVWGPDHPVIGSPKVNPLGDKRTDDKVCVTAYVNFRDIAVVFSEEGYLLSIRSAL